MGRWRSPRQPTAPNRGRPRHPRIRHPLRPRGSPAARDRRLGTPNLGSALEIPPLLSPTVIGDIWPLLDQLLGRGRVEGDDDPVGVRHDRLMPDVLRDRDPSLLQGGAAFAPQGVRLPSPLASLTRATPARNTEPGNHSRNIASDARDRPGGARHGDALAAEHRTTNLAR